MAGLMLNPQIINQDWGTAVLTLARALAQCNGIAALIGDTGRNPPGGSAGLQAAGLAAADADLMVASFTDIANLYGVAHGVAGFQVKIGAGNLGASDFFFNARKLMGTVPMP